MRQTTEEILKNFPNAGRDALIPILQKVQDEHGFLSKEILETVASHLNISTAKVYGVASFYNQFRFHAPGRFNIQICRGTACHVKGSLSLLQTITNEIKVGPGQTTKDGLFSLEVVACIGACGLAPVLCIDGEFHAAVTNDKVGKILDTYRKRVQENG